MKIYLKDRQRAFLRWTLVWRKRSIGQFNCDSIGGILRNGYYDTDGEQRILNEFRRDYMSHYSEFKEDIDAIQK